MIGKIVAHYKIIAKLGEGGMGVVYKAQDLQLERFVALKFLSPHLHSSEEQKQRFIQEAKAASALDHNNICAIHEIGQDDDGPMFIVMPYYEGETLDQKIGRGPLNVEEALDIARQTAEGLAKAHEKDIVHRDLKPANVMLTHDGVVKLLDFGLAKLAGLTKLTREGVTLGTAAYMSPEQARGTEVDHRTDIFSLGALIYEMLTGQLPFKGDYEPAVIYSILHEDPEPLTAVRVGVPRGLERIISKCLQKELSERYQSVNELLMELRQIDEGPDLRPGPSARSNLPKVLDFRKTLLAGSVLIIVILAVALYSFFGSDRSQFSAERKMLVVLPFENLGPAEEAYFASGMTEEITSRLAAVRELGVISRISAAQYNRAGKTLQEMADDFGVNYVLDGTVRWNRGSGGENKVRITPELVRVSDGIQLWSERYDRVMDDIFVVQSEIAEQVVHRLGFTLLEDDQQIMRAKPTANLEAYDYYLRGNDYSARRSSKKDAELAVPMYEKAVALDPNFTVASAALSRACVFLAWTYLQIDQLPKARVALDRAQKLSPDLAETHLAQGYYYYYGSRNYDKALEHFNIVHRHLPNDAEVMAAIGWIWRRQGKWAESSVQLEQALELDPRNYNLVIGLGQNYLYMRQYAQAERYLDRAISMGPDIASAYGYKAQLYLSWLGSTEKARQVLEDAAGRIDQSVLNAEVWALGRVYVGSDTLAHYVDQAETYYKLRQKELAVQYADSARTILQAKIETQPERAEWHQWLGWSYAYLGRREDAIREARKAVELLPVSKDALSGCWMEESLALLYTVVGEPDAAIDRLEYLLTIPSIISVQRLKFQPEWEPLHKHPRFKRLLEKHDAESR